MTESADAPPLVSSPLDSGAARAKLRDASLHARSVKERSRSLAPRMGLTADASRPSTPPGHADPDGDCRDAPALSAKPRPHNFVGKSLPNGKHTSLVLAASCVVSFVTGIAIALDFTRAVLLPCAFLAAANALLVRTFQSMDGSSSRTWLSLAGVMLLLGAAERLTGHLGALPPVGGVVPPPSTVKAVNLLVAVVSAVLIEWLAGRPGAKLTRAGLALLAELSKKASSDEVAATARPPCASAELDLSAERMAELVQHQLQTVDLLAQQASDTKALPANELHVAEAVHSVDYANLQWNRMEHAKAFDVHLESAQVGSTDTSVVRGSVDVDKNIIDLASMLADFANRPKFDDMLEKTMEIEACSDSVHVLHALYREAWPMSKRDFILINAWDVTDTGAFIASARSVKTDKFPPSAGYERGIFHLAGFCIRQHADPTKCRLTAIAHFNLSGDLPAMMVNWGQSVAVPGMLNTVKKLAVDHTAPEEFVEKFNKACARFGFEGPFRSIDDSSMLPVHADDKAKAN